MISITQTFADASSGIGIQFWTNVVAQRAICYLNKQKYLVEFADYALFLQPWFRPAAQRKAQYLQILGRDDEALDFLETARLHLQNNGLVAQLIEIHSERENWSRMLELLDEARSLTPLAERGVETWLAMREADAHIGLGDFSRGAEQAEKASKVKFYESLARNLRKVTMPGRRVKVALLGYDTVRQSLLIRDPSVRHHTERGYEELARHYEPVGPRGLLLLPPEKARLKCFLVCRDDLRFNLEAALSFFDHDF